MWWNWQTRGTQNPVMATSCGFDPHHRHHIPRKSDIFFKKIFGFSVNLIQPVEARSLQGIEVPQKNGTNCTLQPYIGGIAISVNVGYTNNTSTGNELKRTVAAVLDRSPDINSCMYTRSATNPD